MKFKIYVINGYNRQLQITNIFLKNLWENGKQYGNNPCLIQRHHNILVFYKI